MREMGSAMMGTGEASGDSRALLSAEAAIANPLIYDVSMRGARGVLISITGGRDLTLFESTKPPPVSARRSTRTPTSSSDRPSMKALLESSGCRW
jgi:hypothetical protein